MEGSLSPVPLLCLSFCSLFIFPEAGPDIKYTLGFLRTQLSTTTTILLVFGPKISRVWRGQGDKWDQKAKVRSITASFSLNGVGLMPEDSPDLYQENEELKVVEWREGNQPSKRILIVLSCLLFFL